MRPADKPFALACLTLPAEERAVSQARKFTTVELTAWRITEEVADAARLVVTEFVTNTVRHSGSTEVRLRLTRSRSTVWIEVYDSGLWQPPAASSGPDDDLAESGRGFHLVDAVSRRCGVHRSPSGTCAWAMLPESPSHGGREMPAASLSARADRAVRQVPSLRFTARTAMRRPAPRRDGTTHAD
ncbi:ATP-binding protein [Streptomyces sp. NA02950]|uniref:ATP-binding protein n=1 Tax=Streptomyces sp. NA02950 TaxID=2742137 RepID=UPI001590ED68|nr:ATP-binding protein [Streptomyces sp. NA02950]QKV96106.1 ATP-binding protein [Streptomyces sp. NA02950]